MYVFFTSRYIFYVHMSDLRMVLNLLWCTFLRRVWQSLYVTSSRVAAFLPSCGRLSPDSIWCLVSVIMIKMSTKRWLIRKWYEPFLCVWCCILFLLSRCWCHIVRCVYVILSILLSRDMFSGVTPSTRLLIGAYILFLGTYKSLCPRCNVC